MAAKAHFSYRPETFLFCFVIFHFDTFYVLLLIWRNSRNIFIRCKTSNLWDKIEKNILKSHSISCWTFLLVRWTMLFTIPYDFTPFPLHAGSCNLLFKICLPMTIFLFCILCNISKIVWHLCEHFRRPSVSFSLHSFPYRNPSIQSLIECNRQVAIYHYLEHKFTAERVFFQIESKDTTYFVAWSMN